MNLLDLQISGVAGITAICYLAAAVTAQTRIDHRWLPSICGLCGGLLGVAALYVMPGYPASDPINGAAIGIISGLAATGADQAVKQLIRTEQKTENE